MSPKCPSHFQDVFLLNPNPDGSYCEIVVRFSLLGLMKKIYIFSFPAQEMTVARCSTKMPESINLLKKDLMASFQLVTSNRFARSEVKPRIFYKQLADNEDLKDGEFVLQRPRQSSYFFYCILYRCIREKTLSFVL